MATRMFLTALAVCFIGEAPSTATVVGELYQSVNDSPLRLTVTVVRQKYCAATADTDMLDAQLQLSFTNVSKEPLILFRGSNQIVRIRVSKSHDDIAAGKYELDVLSTWVPSASYTTPRYGDTPGDAFIVLPPFGTFQASATDGFEVSRGEKAPARVVATGLHVLQVVVATWPHSTEQAKELANRWIQNGRFWYSIVTSEPVILKVDQDRLVEDCSKYGRLFADAQRDANAADPETGITALMAAVEGNNLEMFNDLLSRGANINAAAPGGFTALFQAAGSEPVYLKRLIELGANVNVRSKAGQTPLTIAIRAGRCDNVKLLLGASASVDTPGESGDTPLQIATQLLRSQSNLPQIAEIVKLLRRAGAKE